MTTLIIAGSRGIEDYNALLGLVADVTEDQMITKVISGGAKGVDSMAPKIAEVLDVPFEEHPADWSQHGRGAGIVRNIEMAQNGHCLAALWDGKSKGTGHMILEAHKHGLAVYVSIAKSTKVDLGKLATNF